MTKKNKNKKSNKTKRVYLSTDDDDNNDNDESSGETATVEEEEEEEDDSTEDQDHSEETTGSNDDDDDDDDDVEETTGSHDNDDDDDDKEVEEEEEEEEETTDVTTEDDVEILRESKSVSFKVEEDVDDESTVGDSASQRSSGRSGRSNKSSSQRSMNSRSSSRRSMNSRSSRSSRGSRGSHGSSRSSSSKGSRATRSHLDPVGGRASIRKTHTIYSETVLQTPEEVKLNLQESIKREETIDIESGETTKLITTWSKEPPTKPADPIAMLIALSNKQNGNANNNNVVPPEQRPSPPPEEAHQSKIIDEKEERKVKKGSSWINKECKMIIGLFVVIGILCLAIIGVAIKTKNSKNDVSSSSSSSIGQPVIVVPTQTQTQQSNNVGGNGGNNITNTNTTTNNNNNDVGGTSPTTTSPSSPIVESPLIVTPTPAPIVVDDETTQQQQQQQQQQEWPADELIGGWFGETTSCSFDGVELGRTFLSIVVCPNTLMTGSSFHGTNSELKIFFTGRRQIASRIEDDIFDFVQYTVNLIVTEPAASQGQQLQEKMLTIYYDPSEPNNILAFYVDDSDCVVSMTRSIPSNEVTNEGDCPSDWF